MELLESLVPGPLQHVLIDDGKVEGRSMGMERLVPGMAGFGLVDEEGTAVDSCGVDGGVEGVLMDTSEELAKRLDMGAWSVCLHHSNHLERTHRVFFPRQVLVLDIGGLPKVMGWDEDHVPILILGHGEGL